MRQKFLRSTTKGKKVCSSWVVQLLKAKTGWAVVSLVEGKICRTKQRLIYVNHIIKNGENAFVFVLLLFCNIKMSEVQSLIVGSMSVLMLFRGSFQIRWQMSLFNVWYKKMTRPSFASTAVQYQLLFAYVCVFFVGINVGLFTFKQAFWKVRKFIWLISLKECWRFEIRFKVYD